MSIHSEELLQIFQKLSVYHFRKKNEYVISDKIHLLNKTLKLKKLLPAFQYLKIYLRRLMITVIFVAFPITRCSVSTVPFKEPMFWKNKQTNKKQKQPNKKDLYIIIQWCLNKKFISQFKTEQ